MDSESKSYELAYLFSPSITGEEVLAEAGKFSVYINEAKGMVKHAESPKRRKLAYALNKEKEAYFGWTTFHAPPEHLPSLRKKLDGTQTILRYLLVEEEMEVRPVIARPLIQRFRPAAIPSQPPAASEKPEEKLDLEALDKKLEEILGK